MSLPRYSPSEVAIGAFSPLHGQLVLVAAGAAITLPAISLLEVGKFMTVLHVGALGTAAVPVVGTAAFINGAVTDLVMPLQARTYEALTTGDWGLYAATRPHTSISAYDSTGGQAFVGAAITVNLDAVHVIDTGYALAADVITVTHPGRYEISWAVTAGSDSTAAGAQTYGEAWVENAAVEIAGTRGGFGGKGTAAGAIRVNLAGGNTLRLRAIRTDGSRTFDTIANGSRLLVTRISA